MLGTQHMEAIMVIIVYDVLRPPLLLLTGDIRTEGGTSKTH